MSNFNSLSGFKAEGFVESSAQGKMLGSFTTMPTADASNVGATVLYQGATTVDYVQGSVYKCIMELVDGVNTYSWSKVDITSIPVESTVVQSGNPISSQAIYNADFASNSDLVSGLAGKIDKGTDAADIAAREAALESGITSSKVQQYDGYATSKFNVADFHTVGGNYGSSNPVTTQEFVNSSVATNTANFRGSFSITGTGADGLGLPADATSAQVAAALDTKIGSAATNNDYAFAYLDAGSSGGVAKYDRYKYTGTYGSGGAWGYEYTLNNSSFTAVQWEAINSGINSTKVSTYDGYATGKQDTLVAGTNMDTAPTSGSNYPVTSGGVFSAIDNLSSNFYTKSQTDSKINEIYTDFRGSNWIFGMSFNRSEFSTDPTGCLTYTDDCTGFTPVSGPTATLARVGANSSWVYNNDGTSSNPLLNVCFYATFTSDGVMHEKLNPNNLSQKIATWNNTTKQWTTTSGSSSITTEDTMFCIPTIFLFGSSDFIKVSSSQYYNGIVGDARSHTINGKTYQYLALGVYPAHLADGVLHSMSEATSTVNTTRPTFRAGAQARKVQNGRAMVWNWFQYNLLKILTLFAIKSFHGQDRIGMGGKSYGDKASGQTNAMGPFAGSTSTTISDTNAMKSFIEDFWGHNWEFIDDFACDNTTMNSHILYAGCNSSPTDTPANNGDIPTDKIPLGVFNNTGTAAGWRYGSVFCTHPYAWGMPISEGGSVSAYLCDGIYIGTAATPTLGVVGGVSTNVSGGLAGPSALHLNGGFAYSGGLSGARLAFVFDL